nr:hypothetical protein [Anaerolineae bacterium]
MKRLMRSESFARLTRIGCLPAAVFVGLGGTAAAVFTFVPRVPYWVSDPMQYLWESRLAAALISLAIMQLLAGWVNGLAGAVMGTRLVVRETQSLWGTIVKKLREWMVLPLAVVVLRLIMLAVIGLGAVYAYTDLFGQYTYLAVATRLESMARDYPGLVIALFILGGINVFLGPFLRLRFSIILGAWASALTPDQEARPWAGLSARFGAGLAGLMLPFWLVGLGTILVEFYCDPYYEAVARCQPGAIFPAALSSARLSILLTMIAVLAAVGLITVGQVVLSEVMILLANRRISGTSVRK